MRPRARDDHRELPAMRPLAVPPQYDLVPCRDHVVDRHPHIGERGAVHVDRAPVELGPAQGAKFRRRGEFRASSHVDAAF